MNRRLCLLLVGALATAGLVAGCGGSSSKTNPEVAAAKHDTQLAIADCRAAAANPGLTQQERTVLNSECTDIQNGDTAALKSDSKQLCDLEAKQQPKADQKTFLAGCDKQATTTTAGTTTTGTTTTTTGTTTTTTGTTTTTTGTTTTTTGASTTTTGTSTTP
jgi:hypothetical protein